MSAICIRTSHKDVISPPPRMQATCHVTSESGIAKVNSDIQWTHKNNLYLGSLDSWHGHNSSRPSTHHKASKTSLSRIMSGCASWSSWAWRVQGTLCPSRLDLECAPACAGQHAPACELNGPPGHAGFFVSMCCSCAVSLYFSVRVVARCQ